jgi:signal transduction histidine kinase
VTSVRTWRPFLWLRKHPSVGDWILAATCAALFVPTLFLTLPYEQAGLIVREPDLPGVLLTLLTCAPLAWRRRYPVAVLIAIALPTVVLAALNYAGLYGLTLLIGTYTVAAYDSRRRAVAALGIAIFSAMLGVALSDQVVGITSYVSNLALLTAAWAFGRSIAFRRAYTAQLEERAARLEAERDADLRAVVAEERARIARELHDVVAHHVSVMTVQAAAAQRTMARDLSGAQEAMAAVEATGRDALMEMRRMVGVLRGDESQDRDIDSALAPQPGIADIPTLVDELQRAGLHVEADLEDPPQSVGAGVDLTVYRIVQEALTNTLKHAGPTRARVVVRYSGGCLDLLVEDHGRGIATILAQDQDQVRQGHGLPGMRERISLYGGRLYAGPRGGGGYAVRARIPLDRVPT